MKKGILLLNLGTPNHCDLKSVHQYLKEFLNDPRVIDLPDFIRSIIVNFFIIPFRLKKTTHAYQKIWLGAGSPLLIHSLALKQALESGLGKDYQVELGMRYGNPSIQMAFNKLKTCNDLMVLPLFPQYASSSTGSAVEQVFNLLKTNFNIPNIIIKKDFYAEPAFINAYAEVIRASLQNETVDAIIFSYHGLPKRQIVKSRCEILCAEEACPFISEANASCYRAQCYATSRLLADALHLLVDQYYVAFQSRLKGTKWIEPYTDVLLHELIRKGIKNIAIVCPSFVMDCLETLEEVNIRMREQWRKLGGQTFIAVPCLNTHPQWVEGLKAMVLEV